MQHHKLGFAAVGVAAVGLCAALATTALASSDHGSTVQNVKHAQTVVKEAAKPKAASDAKIKDQPSASELNRQLVQIQREIKVTTGRPTRAQVAEADKLVGQLKAQGKATAAQLAWLALTPAEKRVEAAPVNVN
ncbi:hypothetical protein [Streptomyces hokutonensis]|uniref:hypothetical protein n=1 Tax=Streptomyces hokutonensis TaxID=1306990 RepID=UPI00036AC87E|nr:hypothetical protein [Streptomyces hokutonensis]